MPDKNKKNKASKFRMMRPVQGQHVFGQPEGSVSTHISSVFESDGKYFVAPTITNKKAPYAGYQPQSFGEAYRAGEAIPFDSFDEAMFFSQNYKLPKYPRPEFKNGGSSTSYDLSPAIDYHKQRLLNPFYQDRLRKEYSNAHGIDLTDEQMSSLISGGLDQINIGGNQARFITPDRPNVGGYMKNPSGQIVMNPAFDSATNPTVALHEVAHRYNVLEGSPFSSTRYNPLRDQSVAYHQSFFNKPFTQGPYAMGDEYFRSPQEIKSYKAQFEDSMNQSGIFNPMQSKFGTENLDSLLMQGDKKEYNLMGNQYTGLGLNQLGDTLNTYRNRANNPEYTVSGENLNKVQVPLRNSKGILLEGNPTALRGDIGFQTSPSTAKEIKDDRFSTYQTDRPILDSKLESIRRGKKQISNIVSGKIKNKDIKSDYSSNLDALDLHSDVDMLRQSPAFNTLFENELKNNPNLQKALDNLEAVNSKEYANVFRDYSGTKEERKAKAKELKEYLGVKGGYKKTTGSVFGRDYNIVMDALANTQKGLKQSGFKDFSKYEKSVKDDLRQQEILNSPDFLDALPELEQKIGENAIQFMNEVAMEDQPSITTAEYGGSMKKFKYDNGGKGSKTYLDSQRKRVTGSPIIPGMNFESDATMFGSPLLDPSYMQMMLDNQPGDQAPFDYRSIMNEDLYLDNVRKKPTTDFDAFLKAYRESGIDDRAYGGKAPKYPDGGKFEDFFRPKGYYNSIYEGQVLPDSVDRSIPNTFYIQPFYNETTKEMMASGEQGFQGPQKRFSKQRLAKSIPNIGQHIESTLLPIREKMLNAKTKEEYDSLQKEYNDLMPASNLSRGISNYLDSIAVQGFGFSKGDQVKIKKQYGGEAEVDYEAEGGEVVIGDISVNKAYNGGMATKYKGASMYKLGGPSHADGGIGIKMNGDDPSYVFTDRLKVGGMKGATYADMASKFGNELDEISRMAMGGDVYDRNTSKRMNPRIMAEVKDLYDDQEAFKKEQGIDQKPDMAFAGGMYDVDPAAGLTPPGMGAVSPQAGGGILQKVFGKLGAGIGMTPGATALQFLPSAFNLAKGLFGRQPEVDLGTYEPILQEYRDYSPLEESYLKQGDRSLATLRAGLEGSGATGSQLRAGLQAGTSTAQVQAGNFYDRLGIMQKDNEYQVDNANIAELNRAEQINQQIAAQEAQMEQALNPLNSLSKGFTQGLGTLTSMRREGTQRGMLKGMFGDDIFTVAYGGQFGLRKK